MTLAAKLQDVEQQLLRATQVVQLHVRLTGTLASNSSTELDEAEEKKLLGLIDSVECAQMGLKNVTTQLLALATCRVSKPPMWKKNEENTETSDNLNETVAKDQSEKRSSLEKYTAAAKNAEKMVIDPEDVETVETWRRIVEMNGLDANREFLELLTDGNVDEKVALAFLKATDFAVSVLTYQTISQKPSWLIQLVEDLTDVENTAKDSKVATVLAPVQKCRDDLVTYCSRDNCDSLETMANYLSQDVVGEAPRTEEEWIRFREIGYKLANWMQILSRAQVKCSKVDALLVSSYFREFEARFPGALPAVLHESWCQITGTVGVKKQDNYEASLGFQRQTRTAVQQSSALVPNETLLVANDEPKPLAKKAQIMKVAIYCTRDADLKEGRDSTISNEMPRCCDKSLLDCFNGTDACLKDIERASWDKSNPDKLQSAVRNLGEKLRSICAFKISRQNTEEPLIWQEESWKKFNDIGLVLSHWLKRVGKSLDGYKRSMTKELIQISSMFPGQVVESLLTFYVSENTRGRLRAASCRIYRMDEGAYTNCGIKRARDDPDIVRYQSKRMGSEEVTVKPGAKERIMAHLRMGKAIAHGLAYSDVFNTKSSKRIQNYLDQTQETNTQVLQLEGQEMGPNTWQTFDKAMTVLADVVWRSPLECTTYPTMKALLSQLSAVLKRIRGMGKPDESLTASYKSLQKYWGVHYVDIFHTIRAFAAETSSMLDSMNSVLFGLRVHRLVLYYRNACDVYFHELNGIISFARKNQVRVELSEIGEVVDSWVHRVLEDRIPLQKLVNAAELITRMIDVLPGCAPASILIF
ncbi:hypothetical protein GN958_ATG06681 [Phytophthora infestans]|uniref:Uncharacterized protein n=1 Tax=Phytophthora infestans TaxID=4787 RepID=A0A8S9UY62_PHYIN|nr:hypothetical protein GN958_ATG06681 [Phytophthora infestans]